MLIALHPHKPSLISLSTLIPLLSPFLPLQCSEQRTTPSGLCLSCSTSLKSAVITGSTCQSLRSTMRYSEGSAVPSAHREDGDQARNYMPGVSQVQMTCQKSNRCVLVVYLCIYNGLLLIHVPVLLAFCWPSPYTVGFLLYC